MVKIQKNLMQKVSAVIFCVIIVFGALPNAVFAVENPLALPVSVSLIDSNGVAFTTGQEVTPGEGFSVIYNYGTVDNINSSIKYLLPTLSNQIEVIHAATEDEIVAMPITSEDMVFLGTLEVNTHSGAMTFQFDGEFNNRSLDDFFLKFAVQLDKDTVKIGDEIIISFPIIGYMQDFTLTVVDKGKTPPKIVKSGIKATDETEFGNVEILWTITLTNAQNPQQNIIIHDTWLDNQEYVDDSFRKDGVSVSDGLILSSDGIGFQYELTDITPNSVYVFTYKTRIKSSEFLKNGLPLTGGSIKCTNKVQSTYPLGGDSSSSDTASASYSHPITWLYKTSGNVIDRETGEMEWTITIYNNGLGMQNVVLYDRLSPGVSVKGNTATMQIGNGSVQTLNDFARIDGADLVYNSDSSRTYNISYTLGNLGNVTTIKYNTIITKMDEYNAGAHLPPDSIFDNKAFITYQIPSGGGLSSVIASPVVEKSGGYDTGLIGKQGEIEPAYHTIKWTMTVNNNNESLNGVTVTDRLTYADPILADENGVYKLPDKYRLCNHIYDDNILRNRPQYSLDGTEVKKFSLYDAEKPSEPFTYRLVPTDKGVYEIVFYLGNITNKVTITFRSTATDEIIFANNVSSTNCHYENKATLVTDGNAFSYASADVPYKSNVYQKEPTVDFFSKQEPTYNYEENMLPWRMLVNLNQMKMTDIVITDFLSAGTSLVEDTMIVGLGKGSWYDLKGDEDTLSVPKYYKGVTTPYYTYDEGTRELKIYLNNIDDIAQIGTEDAIRQIVFYVKVDVDHPIFNDPNYKGYIANKKGIWTIPNTGTMENNYLSKKNAVNESASYNVYVQHLNKTGTAFKNGEYYSIDYSLAVNRIQQNLPNPAVIQDTLPIGLRLVASTLQLYEATVISPDMFYVNIDGTTGKLVKGAPIDSNLYSVETAVNTDGTTTMRITLPQNSGKKMYIVEYSCDVTDVSKAPFTNSALIEGVELSNADQTTTRVLLTSASGGGTLRDINKTTIFLTKTNSVTGIAVQGAVFGIYYNGLLLEKKTTDENGHISFNNLNENYTYTITELEAAPGYLAPVNVRKTVVATNIQSPVSIEFENPPIAGTVHFIKTDQDGVALSGAEFGIWENDADISVTDPLATAISGENGVVTFLSLTAGTTYFIKEISAPENYQISEDVIVAKMGMDGAMEKLCLQSDMTGNVITTFVNSHIPDNPHTGDAANLMLWTLLLIYSLVGVCYCHIYCFDNRKKK